MVTVEGAGVRRRLSGGWSRMMSVASYVVHEVWLPAARLPEWQVSDAGFSPRHQPTAHRSARCNSWPVCYKTFRRRVRRPRSRSSSLVAWVLPGRSLRAGAAPTIRRDARAREPCVRPKSQRHGRMAHRYVPFPPFSKLRPACPTVYICCSHVRPSKRRSPHLTVCSRQRNSVGYPRRLAGTSALH